MNRLTPLLATALTLSACTLIPPQPGADDVVITTEAKVATCENKGTASAQGLGQVGGINRLPDVVAKELARLGANEAAKSGANAIVPLGEVTNGSRKYGLYKCPAELIAKEPRPFARDD